jgi:hypothetical protein
MAESTPRSEALLAEIRREFPSFEILHKRDSALQRTLHVILATLTLGGQREYMTAYHTAMFGKLWVPDRWDAMGDLDRYVLLRHERVHLRQRRRMGDPLLAFVYLVPFLPLFLAYGRARLEWEAYAETIRATVEVYGVPAARSLRPHIVGRFVGGAYGWMWPFPRAVGRWFDDVLEQCRRSEDPSRASERSPSTRGS